MTEPTHYSARLGQAPAEALQAYHAAPLLAESSKVFDIYLWILKAHALMLAEQEIIARDHAAAILAELVAMGEAGIDALTLRPDLNDLYMNMQMIIMERLGQDIGGRLHTAVSRNDFDITEGRLYTRARIHISVSALLELMGALLELADAHAETVMPGYTHHSQAAQPVTLGHFLLAHYDVFNRDVQRHFEAYDVCNLSPMGAGALATTGFPINRQRTASLLGCAGLVENSIDATGGQDFLLQFGSATAIACSNMGRLAESLLVWNTAEFGMIVLADKYCDISSIMPQKKNPVALEIIRAESIKVPGGLIQSFGVLKAIPLANGREPNYVSGPIYEGSEKLEVLASVFADIIATLTVRPEVMLEKAKKDFSTTTELADEIVRQTGLAYHQTYLVTGKLVAIVHGRGQSVDAITSALLDEVAEDILGESLGLPEAVVRRALDPVQNVQARSITGGPAPKEVRRMLQTRRQTHEQLAERLNSQRTALAEAQTGLDETVADLIGIKSIGKNS